MLLLKLLHDFHSVPPRCGQVVGLGDVDVQHDDVGLGSGVQGQAIVGLVDEFQKALDGGFGPPRFEAQDLACRAARDVDADRSQPEPVKPTGFGHDVGVPHVVWQNCHTHCV